MDKMVAPLWGFFEFIKNKFSPPLAIDQYFYLIEAIHKIPLVNTSKSSGEKKHLLEGRSSLLNFTKIFWLNNPQYELEYDRYFNLFFDKEVLFEKVLPNEKENTPEVLHNQDATQVSNSPDKDLINEKKPENILEDTRKEEGMIDFELVLRDIKKENADDDVEFTRPNHKFMLADKAIMPFEVRNFAQRLRRKVETTEQVISDRLDIPEMVIEYIQKGFIIDLTYEFDDASYSNVVLLADRNGSMLAYEFIEDNFKESLRQIPHCHVEHYVFNNLPEYIDGKYQFKTAGSFKNELSKNPQWNSKTWFFVLSDAGGHSGIVNKDRMTATVRLWKYLKSFSDFVHWINPIPFEYLNDCTAKRLQMMIPMSHPDDISLHKIIHEAKPTI
ncbi:hypothetical protein ES711_10415 [Gelidibacter salicanalis]|uniref:VWA domain-containing protein n=1 Tax=Gelidibacter salicanalis TaxID=291193 RepID=A0A5C7AGD6_9FLAO|nr:hypothetical protein [Gelidibacter salicanalis]TXE07836.1 hypothetical protein ES711_10415 [Gelidibacter salicanalis]